MSHSHRLVTRLIMSGVAMMFALPAQTAEPQRCATIVEDSARLACYDAVFGAPTRPAAASASEAVPVSAAATAPAPSPVVAPVVAAGAVAGAAAGTTAAGSANMEDQFGLAPAQVKKKAEPPAEPVAPESIESVLKELTRRRTGELIYTLENGQRWIQVEADTDGKLAPGAAVTIRKASMGSYKLVSGSVATRVRRIQ
jgi:hypothetical protein